MKNLRFTLPLATLALALVAGPVAAQETTTPCQQACIDQHKGKADTLLNTRPAPGTDTETHRANVLAAIDTLNNCLKACNQAPPAPVPGPPPESGRLRKR